MSPTFARAVFEDEQQPCGLCAARVGRTATRVGEQLVCDRCVVRLVQALATSGAETVLSPDQFQRLGYLLEVNRRLLHPLGLALAVTRVEGEPDDEPLVMLGPIYDSRADPEGFVYGEKFTPEQRELGRAIQDDLLRRLLSRMNRLGWMVQPLELDDDPARG